MDLLASREHEATVLPGTSRRRHDGQMVEPAVRRLSKPVCYVNIASALALERIGVRNGTMVKNHTRESRDYRAENLRQKCIGTFLVTTSSIGRHMPLGWEHLFLPPPLSRLG